ncbi:hypothetical protein CROQUDRAFT_400282 [Cronartium quercuum f. sp. fusiforme G11]|uniref:Uncharacterized protein n=1 Tax=Cronartium quercuum f. sp. fusiforme G11 TaxID=708437 RepID=A0A9P6N9W5_9BASI|nr:hypothetical protein CROQUDRAFT_400282 [Cronartium quercuum f. sp. fusiforme G11]
MKPGAIFTWAMLFLESQEFSPSRPAPEKIPSLTKKKKRSEQNQFVPVIVYLSPSSLFMSILCDCVDFNVWPLQQALGKTHPPIETAL